MIVPASRFYLLLLVPLSIIAVGSGSAASVRAGWLAAAVIAILTVVDGLLAAKTRVRLTREPINQLHLEQPATVTWTIENLHPGAVTLQLADQPPAGARMEPTTQLVSLPPRSLTRIDYTITPSERGRVQFGDLIYRVQGQLGLAWRQKRQPAALELPCLPKLANARVAELAERKALSRQAGSHRYRWRGSGTQFESLREYSVQDDIRWLDWKATARQSRPISRNYEVERHQQVMLLVDASRALSTFCGERTKFDALLEAAILLSRAVLDQGDSLGLVVFSDKVETYLHPRREKTQFQAVVENLFDKQPRLVEPNFEQAITRAARSNARRTLFIVLTDVTVTEAAKRMMLHLRILTQRHLPLVVTITDETLAIAERLEPRTTEEFYRVGVASERMRERTLLLEELRRSGVNVLDSQADQVAAQAIEKYFEIKARMRL